MGTWGDGNFDSDSACDYLDSIKFQLIKHIEDCFADMEDGALDDCESEIMANVDILSLLTENYYGHHPHVDAERVSRWKSQFLTLYDQDNEGNTTNLDYYRRRRKVIEDTFDKLEQRDRKHD